jgi:hypothetical protein
MNVKELVLNNPVVRYSLVLLLGIGIGAIFYPTKRIEERLKEQYEQTVFTLKQQHQAETSSLQEKLSKQSQESKEKSAEYESKIYKLTVQIVELKSKVKTSYYKIVKPDGTVEIKKYSESEVNESTKVISEIQEEFKQKITEIEKRWEDVHKERVSKLQKNFKLKEEAYVQQIKTLEKEKVVDINKKYFGVEAGLLTNKNYYGHVTGDLFGPIFVGVHGEVGNTSSVGAGLGLRF